MLLAKVVMNIAWIAITVFSDLVKFRVIVDKITPRQLAFVARFIAFPANPYSTTQNAPSAIMSNPSQTIPLSFVQNMLMGARRSLPPADIASLITRAGMSLTLFDQPAARATREQFVRLYELISITTGDEMLGLWSRPIRAGTLKYLGLSLLDAPSLMVAMYRFTRFWNLLLDDYQLDFVRKDQIVIIALKPVGTPATPIIFGHELMIKLTHGMASWLTGRKLPIEGVGFGFSRPAHFAEYANLFPGPVTFDQPFTYVSFAEQHLRKSFQRSKVELIRFVKSAPDDWIFVTFDHDVTGSRVRRYLLQEKSFGPTLDEAANALFMSGRSLARRLSAEGTSFQKIKDDMRRDLAIQRLVKTRDSIGQIASLVGFDNLPSFHRAFLAWTGSTPKAYRRQQVTAL